MKNTWVIEQIFITANLGFISKITKLSFVEWTIKRGEIQNLRHEFFFVDLEIPPKVIMVPFRVPSSLPPSQGVLRLHSQRDCHPYVETRQIQDEKCPQNCTSKCLEIPFRLASSIRQILLIADKTDYQPGETGTVFFESLTSLFSSGAEPSFFQLWTLGQESNFCP